MFALATTTDYADVFLPFTTSSNPLVFVVMGLVVVGFLGLIVGLFYMESDFSIPVAVGGILMILAGVALGLSMNANNRQVYDTITKNMAANVEQKYGAKLNIKLTRFDEVKTLTEPKMYELQFENGATAQYKMYFNENSEPILVDDSKAPSVEELNKRSEASESTDKKASTPSATETAAPTKPAPKTAPTPSELEESAKK